MSAWWSVWPSCKLCRTFSVWSARHLLCWWYLQEHLENLDWLRWCIQAHSSCLLNGKTWKKPYQRTSRDFQRILNKAPWSTRHQFLWIVSQLVGLAGLLTMVIAVAFLWQGHQPQDVFTNLTKCSTKTLIRLSETTQIPTVELIFQYSSYVHNMFMPSQPLRNWLDEAGDQGRWPASAAWSRVRDWEYWDLGWSNFQDDGNISQIIHVWYIYLHLGHLWAKCR